LIGVCGFRRREVNPFVATRIGANVPPHRFPRQASNGTVMMVLEDASVTETNPTCSCRVIGLISAKA
jgi:hypothetical protein